MKLRGIEFRSVLGASGVQGFFGEGYWFHKLWHPFGLDFTGMTFVSKTTTLIGRMGNMALNRNYSPRWPFPRCIRVKLLRGIALNSVGLSGPGLGALLGTGRWQARTEPFLISIMSLEDTPQRRLEELRIMIEMLCLCKDKFKAPFGLQINLSCPNTGHNPAELIGESALILEIASKVGVPLMPKYSIASAPIEAVMELNQHPACDAICVSNTIPFDRIEGYGYKRVWGTDKSPLVKIGGGGISGKILQPLVCKWIERLRNKGFKKPINGGGGILSCGDLMDYRNAGASSVFLGSVAILRPWRVRNMINFTNRLRWN